MGNKEKTKHFEIMFASYISGNFTWSGLDFDDDSAPTDADTPGTHSAEWVSAYREDGTTIIAPSVARIQYQSTTSISGATNFGYIMLSNIATNFPSTNYTGDGGSTYQDYIVLKGSSSNATCRVNLNSTDVQTGRPSKAFAEGTEKFRRVFSMTMETHDNVDDIRQEVAARLGQSAIAMKRGDFNVSKAPYYWADFKVHSVSNDGSTGQNLTVKSDNGTTAINVTNYGFREGMLVHKRTADYSQIATVAVSGVDKDVYGYCYDMTSDSAFKVNLTESQTFAVDDKIRLYIPVRAGDVMFVDHILATTYGEHLVTSVNFNESPRPMTTYSTVGENEPRIRMRVGSINKQNVWNTIAVDKLELRERERPNLPKGTQTFTFTGTFSFPAGNRVAWTAGDLRTSDGEVYQIVASNTNGGTGTSGSDTDYGLGSNGMTGSNKYVLYLDPEGENPSGNEYHLYTILESSYVEDEDNLVVLLMTPTSGAAPDCSKGPNFQNEIVFPHSDLDASGKANPVNVGSTPPSNPAVGDIHIDTDTTNSWQRWDGSSWVTYDLGTAKAIGQAAQSTATTANTAAGNADAKAEQKRTVFYQGGNPSTGSGAPSAVRAGDLWMHNGDSPNADQQYKIFTASATGTGNWDLRDDAGAVNNATTNIQGGRIATQAIILKSGGADNANNANSILNTGTAGAGASRIVLSNTGIFGYNASSEFEFKIDAANGKGTFGGGAATIGKDGIHLQPNDGEAFQTSTSGAQRFELQNASDIQNAKKWWLWLFNGTSESLVLSTDVSESNNPCLMPSANNVIQLGSDAFAWRRVHIDDGDSTVTNPALAFKGSVYKSGIHVTDDGTYVRHYFVGRGLAATTYASYMATNGTYSWTYSTYTGANYYKAHSSGSATSPVYSFVSDTDTGMYLDSGIAFTYGVRPIANDSQRLGSSSYRFKRLYVVNATDVSSDAALKENLTPISNGLDFISSLSPMTFNRKGESEINFGFTAQAMKQAVLDAGYTEDMGVYSEEVNEDTGETRWGVSYETLVAPLVASIKELKERIEVLEGK